MSEGRRTFWWPNLSLGTETDSLTEAERRLLTEAIIGMRMLQAGEQSNRWEAITETWRKLREVQLQSAEAIGHATRIIEEMIADPGARPAPEIRLWQERCRVARHEQRAMKEYEERRAAAAEEQRRQAAAAEERRLRKEAEEERARQKKAAEERRQRENEEAMRRQKQAMEELQRKSKEAEEKRRREKERLARERRELQEAVEEAEQEIKKAEARRRRRQEELQRLQEEEARLGAGAKALRPTPSRSQHSTEKEDSETEPYEGYDSSENFKCCFICGHPRVKEARLCPRRSTHNQYPKFRGSQRKAKESQ